jgi:hypothetical protein
MSSWVAVGMVPWLAQMGWAMLAATLHSDLTFPLGGGKKTFKTQHLILTVGTAAVVK